MPDTPPPANTPPLNGWKEIATYLARSVRSVQRYERELGLPVHRLLHSDGQTVYAFPHEIEAWRRELDGRGKSLDEAGTLQSNGHQEHATTEQSSRARTVLWGIAGAAVLVVFAILVVARSVRAPGAAVVDFVLIGAEVRGLDGSERVVWQRDLGGEANIPSTGEKMPLITDLDGDGSPDALIPVRFGPKGRASDRSDTLYAFGPDGTIRWSFTAEKIIKCGQQSFAAPWQITAVAVSAERGPKTVWVAFSHHTSWPSFVMEIKPGREAELRYAQTGWVFALAPWKTPSGSFLAAGGVTNEEDRPILVLVDLAKPPAMTPAKLSRFSCADMPMGEPDKVYVFPNPETVAPLGHLYGRVDRLATVGEALKVTITAYGGAVIAMIDRNFTLGELSFTDDYRLAHRTLEQAGKIDHPFDRCPWTIRQTVREWTSGRGWQDVTVVPVVRTTLTPVSK